MTYAKPSITKLSALEVVKTVQLNKQVNKVTDTHIPGAVMSAGAYEADE